MAMFQSLTNILIMAIIETGRCTIDYINNHGLGVGKTDIGKVVLPYTIPGEVVSFERHAYRNSSNCLLKAIITPSPKRVYPACTYFGICGGCTLQHIDTKKYSSFKENIIKSLIKNIHPDTKINPIISIPPGQRRRANVEAIKKNDRIYLGFHRLNSHQIINIADCLALSEKLSSILVPLKSVLTTILHDNQRVKIFLTEASNGIDIDIKLNQRTSISSEQADSIINLAKEHNIIRIIFSYEASIIFLYETAKPYVLFDDIAVEIDAQSFLQSSFLSDKILSDLVIKCFDIYKNTNSQNTTILELFCGRGTFTLPLSRYFIIDAFESDINAIYALRKAILNKQKLINLYERDLFKDFLNRKELNNYRALAINPPRAGAEAQCRQIKSSDIEKICYVSCNPETFIRDSKILCSGGYSLTEITPIDQFYWTSHLEIIAFFEKKIKKTKNEL
jgi:23S rRNA (uracil1939-C5)-methyltransferase